MGIKGWIRGLKEKRSMAGEYLKNLFSDNEYVGTAGVAVTETTAYNYSAFFAAVNLIADSVSQLPIVEYSTVDKSRQRGPIDDVLNVSVNDYLSAYTFRHLLTTQALGWGNAYAQIVDGQLFPMPPDKVTPRLVVGGGLVYDVQAINGVITLWDDEVFHLQGFSLNGTSGMNVIRAFREAIGLGLATEKYGASYFGNGARPDGIITAPTKMTPDALANMRKEVEQLHKGPGNAHKLAIFDAGTEYTAISSNNTDSQFLETRKFQINEIARIFRIPVHLLGGEQATGTYQNLEQSNLFYVQFCLAPWLRKWEVEINRKLIRTGATYVEHITDALLRTDTLSRYNAYNIGYNKWLTKNEIRRKENMEPVDGGDEWGQPAQQADPTAFRDVFSDVLGRIQTRHNAIKAKSKSIDTAEEREWTANALRPAYRAYHNSEEGLDDFVRGLTTGRISGETSILVKGVMGNDRTQI